MILDSLKTALAYKELYASVHPLFVKALEFLETANTIADGRYDLEGEKLYVTVGSSVTRSAGEASLEAHDKYIDIQLLLSDQETYGWAPRLGCRKVNTNYDNERDVIFYDDDVVSYITLTKGNIAIFYPNDAHAPLIGNGTVRKAIAKVRVL